jgi:hypothetical protein
MNTRRSFSLGVKRPWRETDSPPFCAEVKNAWNYASIPPYVFMVWHLIKQWMHLDGVYNFKIKKKMKVVPELLTEHHALKAYWRSRGIAPRIFDLGIRWR